MLKSLRVYLKQAMLWINVVESSNNFITIVNVTKLGVKCEIRIQEWKCLTTQTKRQNTA